MLWVRSLRGSPGGGRGLGMLEWDLGEERGALFVWGGGWGGEGVD